MACLFVASSIRILNCGDAFYSDSRSSSILSNNFLPDLVQTVHCPKCDPVRRRYLYLNDVNVYGTTTYTDVSSVCYAAIHAGQITGDCDTNTELFLIIFD